MKMIRMSEKNFILDLSKYFVIIIIPRLGILTN